MCLRICNHVNPVYPVLNTLQYGFRLNRSCVSQSIQHVYFLASSIDNGGKIDNIYLDMAKAFDMVPQQTEVLRFPGSLTKLGCRLSNKQTPLCNH